MRMFRYAGGVQEGDFFPHAGLYRISHSLSPHTVRERPSSGRDFLWTERHLQCLWFDPKLRPEQLLTSTGERVTVEQSGVWNLEPGPDFLDAVIRVDPGKRRIQGDVEIHIYPQDWHSHGHDDDPAYGRVRVHVTYFPGQGSPPGAVHVVLQPTLEKRVGFHLEDVDVTAYPFGVVGECPPCRAALRSWSAAEIGTLLDAAGEERLLRKSERIASQIESQGEEQTWYCELMTALGYKHNKIPFRKLATRVPLEQLLEVSGSNPQKMVAVLAGVAGLLPIDGNWRCDSETTHWLRSVWDHWWKIRDAFDGVLMQADEWKTCGLRPANHPLRRLVAAAWMLSSGERARPAYWTRLAVENPEQAAKEFVRWCLSHRDPYLSCRPCVGGKRLSRPMALLGTARAVNLFVNVVVPFVAARGPTTLPLGDLIRGLQVSDDNSSVRRMAFMLFGPDHSSRLYGTPVRQQGLLQIFQDYCLTARAGCQKCELPEFLERFRDGLVKAT